MPLLHASWSTTQSSNMHKEANSTDHELDVNCENGAEEGSKRCSISPKDSPSPLSTYGQEVSTERRGLNVDRGMLIGRIKKEQSPKWFLPGSRYEQSSVSTTYGTEIQRSQLSSPIEPMHVSTSETADGRTQLKGVEPSVVERPRSALHSGDFTTERNQSGGSEPALSTSPPAPWTALFPDAIRSSEVNINEQSSSLAFKRPHSFARARAISQVILPQNFSLKPPTSPLVYQANSADTETSKFPQLKQLSRSPDRASRRHTFSPRSFQTYHASPSNSYSQTPSPRRSSGIPYQAHQPRRSVSSMTACSTPQTPFKNRYRRPSHASDTSPLHHAPMVGSFEESILRGRMSTNPSQPLDFVAQIGVLGKGSCPSSLRCPPHVTIPFPAVFYTYGSGNGRIPGNLPSPYVGLVDIQNSLTPLDDASELKQRRRSTLLKDNHDDLCDTPHVEIESSKVERRKREKIRRRHTSSKVPPGGSYRIPQQGQIQIVIKNPNKTAVKLFLVPYDLSDMQPGQKTFIRQRSYSAGPIIDMPLSSRENLGTDRPEASLSSSDEPTERPVLRYLIHLHICCPAARRFYLYKSIRVVFANRVLDGEEKLRNEIQLPEPRYSSFKPLREQQQRATSPNGPNSTVTLGQAMSGCSGDSLFNHVYYDEQRIMPKGSDSLSLLPSARQSFGLPGSPVRTIPLNLSTLPTLESRPASRDHMEVDSLSSSQPTDFSPKMSSAEEVRDTRIFHNRQQQHWEAFSYGEGQAFNKLRRGDAGYGGNHPGANLSGTLCGPGLLASRLREFDFRKEDYNDNLSG